MTGWTVAIVGAGQGGYQAAASLREGGFAGRVVLIGDEPELPYQRPPLSKGYLTGEVARDGLWLRPRAFYADHGVELLEGERVAAIERAERRLRLASGATLAYDHLVLATGARDRRLAVPGAELEGVLPLRTLADAERIRERLHAAREIVVIGAGFIGLELAAVAAGLGARVHILEIGRRAMARAVSAEMSRFFAEAHAARGTTILFGAGLARITGAGGRVTGVETGDGLRLPADLVFVGIGVAPNAELAAASGLPVDNGIVVDEKLRTPDEAVSAIGDCASYPSPFASGRRVRLESVQNAVDQGRCVAARLAGRPAPSRSVPWFWSEQGDLRLQMAGLTAGHDIAVLRGDAAAGRFSVFCFEGSRLLGVESVNSPADHMVARRLLAAGADLTPQQAADEGFDLKSHAVASARRNASPGGPAVA